jgi:hypothetical protein
MKRAWSTLSALTVFAAGFSFSVGWNGTAGATTWPKTIRGRLLDHPRTSMPFDSIVAKRHLLVGWMGSKNDDGKYAYALADIGTYEYPVSTNDHGDRWRVAGNYFNLDDTSGMGAGNSPSNIVTLSPTIAVAYRRGDIIGPVSVIFVTIDAGKEWYIAYAPGSVKKVTSVLGGPNDSVLRSLTATVSSEEASGKERTYTSQDDGQSWLLR